MAATKYLCSQKDRINHRSTDELFWWNLKISMCHFLLKCKSKFKHLSIISVLALTGRELRSTSYDWLQVCISVEYQFLQYNQTHWDKQSEKSKKWQKLKPKGKKIIILSDIKISLIIKLSFYVILEIHSSLNWIHLFFHFNNQF